MIENMGEFTPKSNILKPPEITNENKSLIEDNKIINLANYDSDFQIFWR